MTDSRQWVQPLFMIYDMASDEKVPLTQERLDQLLAVENQYRRMISSVRDMHEELASRFGQITRPFTDLPGPKGA